jgi:CheY-like chemotaxis protein
MRKHILCISHNVSLLRTREMILRGAGHEVTSALGLEAALSHCNSSVEFDLCVIGHSVPSAQKQVLIDAFRKTHTVPIVVMDRADEPAPSNVYLHEAGEGPAALLAKIQRVLQTSHDVGTSNVIWMCRKEELDNVHFDTRQYPFIVYNSIADARKRHHCARKVKGPATVLGSSVA